MNLKRNSILAACILLILSAAIQAQTAAFTYQGSLNDNANEANGSYQMRFSIFTAVSGGMQIGQTLEYANVQIADGVFSVQLDFGAAAFADGGERYLQIEVRRNAGESYVPLNPRQRINSTPYAVRSATSGNAEQLGGVGSSQFVQTNDPRLSDARTPTAGSNNYVQNRTTTQGNTNFDIDGTGEAGILSARIQFDLNGFRILSSPGTNNTFVGINTGTDLTTGARNTFVGRNTGGNTTTGNTNTFVGSGAGFENTEGSSNSFFGFNAGLRVTTGNRNSMFGVSAGSALLTEHDNSFFGYEAGLNTVSGNNSFFGARAGRSNTSGNGNTFLGNGSGIGNTTGNFNTFVGDSAGEDNAAAEGNTFVGFIAGFLNQTGEHNAFFGWQSGEINNSGSNNSFFGKGAGRSNTTGSNNSAFGNETEFSTGNLSFATVIGAGAVASNSNTIQLGRQNLDEVRIGKFAAQTATHICVNTNNVLAFCSSSIRYKNDIAPFRSGLDILDRLRPVSFRWKESGIRDFGLVAEEVAEIEPLLVTTNPNGEIQGVKYDRLGVVLINVVKEQQNRIEDQQNELDEQKKIIARQQTEIDRLKKQQTEFDAFKRLICADKSEAEVCRETETGPAGEEIQNENNR